MITTYRRTAGDLVVAEGNEALDTAAESVWLDLLSPREDEEARVEDVLGADIPTRADMAEIEVSSRLYMQQGAAIMTIPLLIKSDSDYPESTDVTLVLTDRHLASVRYAEPPSFRNFAAAIRRNPDLVADPATAFAALLDAMINRIADVLEKVGADLDDLSRTVFGSNDRVEQQDFEAQIRLIGRSGEIVSKARDSLVGLARVTAFARVLPALRSDRAATARLKAVARDADVLREHVGYLAGKVTFLLDANLGMINIEQSAIIKIFSVAAVVFLPPTMIASIYGMNFDFMPELGWRYGYAFAIGAMIVSMIIPIWFFRRKRWI